jgi:hypothetical protein
MNAVGVDRLVHIPVPGVSLEGNLIVRPRRCGLVHAAPRVPAPAVIENPVRHAHA